MRCLSLLLALAAASAQPASDAERRIGEQMAAEARRQLPAIEDADASAYLDSLGRRLAAALPSRRFEYTFTLVRSNSDQPLAIPGGAVMIPLDLARAAASESEVAAAVAHSIAHINARHGLREASRGAATIASAPLVYVGGWMGPHAQDRAIVPKAAGAAMEEWELNADRDAVTLCARAGFDTRGLLQLAGRTASPMLDRVRRIRNIEEAIAAQPAGQIVRESGRFEQFRQRLEKLRTEPERPPPSLYRR